jgi:hypothetical protein
LAVWVERSEPHLKSPEYRVQIPSPVNDANDLDRADRPFIGIGVSAVQQQVRDFDQHTHRWTNVGPAHAHSRLRSQQFRLGFDAIKIALSGGGRFKPDHHIDFQ